MKYGFIGWCKDESVNADKIWCAIELKQGCYGKEYKPWTYLTVWGRRGKALQHKIVESDYELRFASDGRCTYSTIGHKVNEKLKKYKKVDINKLNEVYPEFETDLKQATFWALLEVKG